jgi:hypothetical protein
MCAIIFVPGFKDWGGGVLCIESGFGFGFTGYNIEK